MTQKKESEIEDFEAKKAAWQTRIEREQKALLRTYEQVAEVTVSNPDMPNPSLDSAQLLYAYPDYTPEMITGTGMDVLQFCSHYRYAILDKSEDDLIGNLRWRIRSKDNEIEGLKKQLAEVKENSDNKYSGLGTENTWKLLTLEADYARLIKKRDMIEDFIRLLDKPEDKALNMILTILDS